MLIRILIRRILLVLLALMLNSCILAQVYRDSQQYRDREFFRRYRPPTEINGREFNSSVTLLPDRARLINGDGYEYEVGNKRHKVVMNLADYFIPGDDQPFDPPARVTSVQYFYCVIGDDAPTECGGKITYESEEVFGPFAQWSCVPPACVSTIQDVSKIRQSNHELIIDQIVSNHGRRQKGENDTQVFTEEEDGTITRSLIGKNQRRIWCDFSEGVPKQCKRSIIALFSPSSGRGTILYIDERMYNYLRRFETELRHRHPGMNVIRGEKPAFEMSPEDQAWWVGRLSQSSPNAFIAWEKLQTEIQLEARAKAAGKPRLRAPRTLTEEEFKREWVTAWVNLESADTAGQDSYWYGYLEALLDRDFNYKNRLTDEAHKKWTVLSREILSTVAFVGDGYIDGLDGIREPRYGVSKYPNWKWGEMNCCEDRGMKLLRKN